MLRAYSLSPRILRGELGVEDQNALGRIIAAIAHRVTLAAPRPDLLQLCAVIQRSSLGLSRERLREQIFSELTGCGAGVFSLSTGSVLRTPKKTLELLIRAIRIDGMLLAAEEPHPRWLPGGVPAIQIEEAAEAIERESIDLAFRGLPDEAALLAKLQEFFLYGGELAIVDPYLPVTSLRPRGFKHMSTGIETLVRIAADPSVRRGRPVRIRVVGCEGKLQRHVADKKGSQVGAVHSLAIAKQEVEQRLKGLITRAAAAVGVSSQDLDFGLAWSANTLERGIVSSGRCWRIEHSLSDLGVVLAVLRGKGKWRRSEEPTLRLLLDDGARNLKGVARTQQRPQALS
jgi:hypothetical protein